MKDADKAWRATPHGFRTICGWYDYGPHDHVETLEAVSNPHMLTAPGRAYVEAACAAVRAEAAIGLHMNGGKHE